MVPIYAPRILGGVVVTVMVVVLGLFLWGAVGTGETARTQIVSGVSEWAVLAHQVVGPDATVVSLITDPNADPHEHEATVSDALHVAGASLVIENGAGYDTWLEKLVASSNSGVATINVATLMGVDSGENPHIFYNPVAALRFVRVLRERLRGARFAGVQQRARSVTSRLVRLQASVLSIRRACAGVRVAATEDVTSYLLQDMGLDIVTPEALRVAVGNGVDPSVGDLATALAQVRARPALLVDNIQTATPLTNELVATARASHVPVIRVTETMRGTDYVTWLSSVVRSIEHALTLQGCWS